MTQQQIAPQAASSVEDFLKQGGAPTDARHWLEAAYDAPDPMSQVGAALCGLLGTVIEMEAGQQREHAVATGELVSLEEHTALRAEYDDLEAAHGHQKQLVEDIVAACGKSRGQLAVRVRDLVEKSHQAETPPPAPEPDAGTGEPEASAST